LHSAIPALVRDCLTSEGEAVIDAAEKAARTYKHAYIGTEHFLLGLMEAGNGLVSGVFEELDLVTERVHAQVVRTVGIGEEEYPSEIPLTPKAKKVLELSLREALSLGTREIKSEHILLGLVRENEGVAARILLDFDADAEKVRNAVIRAISGSGELPVAPPPIPDVPAAPSEVEAVMHITVPPGMVVVLRPARGHKLHSTPKRGGTKLRVRAKKPGFQPRQSS
jgi:ATP-dependent Clp protease ATP-binding subunit ClpA